MSGSSGEKTELPTPKRERDARQRGQVARSQEAVTAGSLLAVILYVWLAWGDITRRLVGLFDLAATLALGDFRVAASQGLAIVGRELVAILAPVVLVTIVAAVATNVLQFGILFAFEALQPKLDKISPAAGVKRIFSMKQVVELLKSLLKIAVLSVLLYYVLRDTIGPFTYTLACGLPCQINLVSAVLMQTLLYSGAAFVIVALADFAYQKHHHVKSLMMSKDEVKREYKESEGDPHIKGKRKQIAQELAMGDGGEAARKGTAVVVNPTHLAVVLHYDPETAPVPVVTAKGREAQAVYLRGQAELAGVPVFRNVPLTRTLYAETAINETIPDALFDVVAEVLAWVARNRHLLYRERLAHGVIDMEAGDHRRDPAGAAARERAP
ncbi:type III secretion system export apparatus subunit SctU [uncultured Methylobacterium sp.]|uniref:type III secretion system export apparatus subunit SctU n=1 Tax=uncultured Methylobacterium sp. TaxID=157278 RepID=UPI00261923F0|nr:type III secretion system export apparatus subunit SctU [uncultured Methylobacterium sp.]